MGPVDAVRKVVAAMMSTLRRLSLLLLLLAGPVRAAEPDVVLPEVRYAAPLVVPPAAAPAVDAAVQLEVVVGPDGKVRDATVLEAPDDVLGALARETLLAYVFRPATVDGEPVGVTITYLLPIPAAPPPPPRPSVRGVVREAGTRALLPGAVVDLRGPDDAVARVIAGSDGAFALPDLAPGAWTLTLDVPGARRRDVEVEVRPDEAVTVTLFAFLDRPWEEGADEVVEVVSEAPIAEVSSRRLDAQAAMALPGTNGDILKAVLNFPGLARPPLGIGQLIVRGKRPDATSFYVDGVRIPQVFHFGGLSTVLNGDVIQELRFLPGNTSVRYGDGQGGVLDLVTRTDLPERSRGYLSVDLYQASAFVEQKVGPRTLLSVSARRSYADAVLGPILSELGGGQRFRAPAYYDVQARVLHQTDRGTFDALVAFSDDQFRLLGGADGNVAFGLSNTFLQANFGWRGRLADGWRTETRFALGPERQSFQLAGADNREEAVTGSLRQEFARDVPAGGRLGWRLGVDVVGSAFRFGLGGFATTPRDEGQGFRLRPALYAEATTRFGPVDVAWGLRGSLQSVIGTSTAYALDPRLAATVDAGPTTDVVATLGRYSQFPLAREVLTSSRGNPDLRPSWSLSASAGLRQRLPYGLSLEATAFWDELLSQVVGRADRFEFTSGPPTPTPGDRGPYANDGRGRVYGGELLLRLQDRRATAWLSATVSRSTRTDRDGVTTLFPFDQTLTLNALGSYQLPKRWTLGGRVRVSTGNPYLPVVNRVQDAASHAFVPIFGDTPERLRTAWFLDVRIDKQWVFRKWSLTLFLDVQGITDGGNVELMTYSSDYATPNPVTSTPALPAFGLKGAW